MEEVRANYSLVEGLHHPNICGIKTLEKDARGGYYLVMDLARGTNLNRWPKAHPEATDAEKLAIPGQIAAALEGRAVDVEATTSSRNESAAGLVQDGQPDG